MAKNTNLEVLGFHWELRSRWLEDLGKDLWEVVWNWAELWKVVRTGQRKEEESCLKLRRTNESSTFKGEWIEWQHETDCEGSL